MATELEIITHEKTAWAFNEALKAALLSDPAIVKGLGLPGFSANCKIDIGFAVKSARDWDEDSTAAEINFSLMGVISAHVVDAEGTAKLKGLMPGWPNMPADYAVGMPRFQDMNVRAKVVA